MSTRPRRRATAVGATLVAALVALLAAGSSPARAQAADPDVELRVTALSGVLATEAAAEQASTGDQPPAGVPGMPAEQDLSLRLLVENRGDEPVDGLRVVVEVHPAAEDRDELADALEGDGLGGSLSLPQEQPVRDLDALEPGEIAGVEEVVERGTADWAEGGGVHPVRIAVMRGTEVLDEVVTAVVWLEEEIEEPLLTTVVWPVTDTPWQTAGGGYPRAAQRPIRPGGRIDVLLSALEQHTDAGILLAPAAHLLEDLRDQRSGFTRLEREEDGARVAHEVGANDAAAARAGRVLSRLRTVVDELAHPPVAGPYADADLAALLAHDQPLRELAGELATAGRRQLLRVLPRPPDAGTSVIDYPVGADALELVPGEHLLLGPDAVVEGEADGHRLRQVRSPSGRLWTASVGDAAIGRLLAEPQEEGLVAAQRVVAETAMRYFEAPDVSGRTLSVHPPSDFAPGPEMAHTLLDGLSRAGWLDLVSPSAQAGRGEHARAGLQLREPEGPGLAPDHARALTTALGDLEAVTDARPPDAGEDEADEEGATPERSYGALRTSLWRSTSRWLLGSRAAQDLVRDVQHRVDDRFGAVEIASESRVTLTSDTGHVPVTVRRTRGGPLNVRIEVASQGSLRWEQQRSDELLLDDDEAQTVSFEARALGTGTFPVTVVVTDPSGTRELARETLSVRSTAVSGAALSATGALVLVLLLVGALRRRPRGPRLRVVSGEDRQDDDG